MALAEQLEIVCGSVAVFSFEEIQRLRGTLTAELAAIGIVKAVFPTKRGPQ